MKTIDDINLYTWFSNRELEYVPEHFVLSSTPLTPEAKEWIKEKLVGRFAIKGDIFANLKRTPAFEDPKEAVFYELTWG